MFKAPFGYVNDAGSAENEQQERKAVKCFSLHFPVLRFQIFAIVQMVSFVFFLAYQAVKIIDNTIGFKC